MATPTATSSNAFPTIRFTPVSMFTSLGSFRRPMQAQVQHG